MYRIVLTNLNTGHKLQRFFTSMAEGVREAQATLIRMGYTQDGLDKDGLCVWQTKVCWQN